jgi:hypothetical protein
MTSTEKTSEELKEDFLEEVRISGAINDALKVRGGHHVYQKLSEEKTPEARKERRKHSLRREEFREELRSNLQRLAEDYKEGVSSDEHIGKIRKLAADLSSRYKDILDGDLSFGVAAKALNVYLKSRWCADREIKPPHCPFDDRVLQKIKPPEVDGQDSSFHATWTDATEDHYKEWVSLATKAAGGVPLPEWELKLWQDSVVAERTKIQERLKRNL